MKCVSFFINRDMAGYVKSMRPTVIIILAVLIAALLAFDTYEYDGHYLEAAWEQAKHQAVEIEHTVENWLNAH